MSPPVIPFDIPHRGSATYENQSKLDRIDFAIILWASMGWAWESNAAITPQSPRDLTLHVAAGTVQFSGVSSPTPAGNVSFLPDATNPRFALVGADQLATVSYTRAGTTVTMKLAVDPIVQGWLVGQPIIVTTNSGPANATATITAVSSNGDGTGNVSYTNGSGTITTTAATGTVTHIGVWHGAIQPTSDKPPFPAIPFYGAVILGSVYLPPAVAVLAPEHIIDKRVPHLASSGGGGGGSIVSVNGQTGPAVTLAFGDVGAQGANINLAAIALLTTTAFGRSVLEVANAPALRGLMGLGNAAIANIGSGPGTVAAGNDPRFVTVNVGTIYGGDAPYFMGPGRTPDQNSAAFVQLLTDAAAQGRKAVLPGFGPNNPMLMAPWALTLAGDRYINVEGQGQNLTVLQQAQGASGAWFIPFTGPAGGPQNYWGNVNGNTTDGSIVMERMTLRGGHAQKPSPQDTEASWAIYGIGLRAGRRVTFRDMIIGGFHRGMQFDGQLDHNDFNHVIIQGNWDNVYFGPKTAIKDSTFYRCTFSSASRSCIAIDALGALSGSSFYGCHLGTAPYGIYIASGAKPGTALMMQSNAFIETIWEGCGNYRIFCEDGDSRLDNLSFDMAQFHGIEAGDNANVNGSQHMFHCAQITNLARAATGVVAITVTNGAVSKIEAGQYITLNGDTTTLPPPGPTVGGSVDASFLVPYRVIGRLGNVITAQGTNTTVVASAPATGFVARIGMFRAGQITDLRGNADFNPDEIKTRDAGYGWAAELYVDVDDADGWDLYDAGGLYNIQCRTSRHLADPRYNRMRSKAGSYFLCQMGGAVTPAQKPAVVTHTGSLGDAAIGAANRESAGVVGGSGDDHFPISPQNAYLIAGDYAWVQEAGVAAVRGAPASAGGQTLVAGATGQATALAAGTAPGTTDFRVGQAIGPNLAKLG